MSINPNSGKLVRTRMTWESDFTMTPNAWLRDKRLSFTARGVLAWLQSHESSFEVTLESISAASTHGVSAIRSAVRELETYGYLKRYRERRSSGRLGGTVWEQLDPFETEHPKRAQLDFDRLLPITEKSQNTSSEPKRDKPTEVKPTEVKPTEVNRTTIEDHLEEDSLTKDLNKSDVSKRARAASPAAWQRPAPAPKLPRFTPDPPRPQHVDAAQQAINAQAEELPCPDGFGTGKNSRHWCPPTGDGCVRCGRDSQAILEADQEIVSE